MIQHWKNIFGEFDKIAKSDAFIYDFKFSIVIANPKETFDIFFARFISVIIPLNFIDRHKISNF